MFLFNNEESYIYRKGLIILPIIMIISITFTKIFDGAKIESYFWFIWSIAAFINVLLLGIREVFARENNIGYIYFLFNIVFILGIIYI
ncbi:MAG: hypothetical protein FH751_00530 [Firmicutes bacterium]|nr:hypothetical protein [Bacillota bacterium]